MHIVILVVLGVLLIFGPQFWARHVLKRYSVEQDHFPGTGGELARHLLDKQGLHNIYVEAAESGGDHYDPQAKRVRLSPANLTGKSLTAKAISRAQVNLAWAEASSNEAGFKIERSLSSSSSTFTEIGTAGPNVRSYQDLAGINANTTYYYRVKAYAGTSSSGYSNTRSIKTPR